jgi:hypothetical protein
MDSSAGIAAVEAVQGLDQVQHVGVALGGGFAQAGAGRMNQLVGQ